MTDPSDSEKPAEQASPKSEPWVWHVQETYKGLITLSVEALKILALVNGGAAVALISFCGNLASKGLPMLLAGFKSALFWYCGGLASTMLAFIVAYFAQLRLYGEERRRHEGKPFRQLHGWLISAGGLLTLFSVVAFGGKSRDLGELTAKLRLSHLQIILGLQPDPQLRAGPEVLTQQQRRFGANRSLASGNLTDLDRRNSDILGHLVSGQPQRLHKIFPKNVPRMDWF